MPRLRLVGKGGKRQRLLSRINKFASSPSLRSSARASTHAAVSKDKKHSVSCVSLSSGSVGGDAEMVTPPGSPMRESADMEEEVFMECEEMPRGRGAGGEWEGLPDECKMQVLRWLEPLERVRCSAVSKQWQQLCFDGQLWADLDASKYHDRIPVEQLAQLIVSAGPFVRNLNLRGCLQLQKDWRIESVANACRNLYSATLEGCAMERPIVHFIILRNPQLVQLNLSGLLSVTNSTCRMIAQSCPNLETLDISFCKNADGKGLRRLADRCDNLRVLKANTLRINDTGLMLTLFQKNTLEQLYLGSASGLRDETIRLLLEGKDPEIDPFTNRAISPPRKLTHLDLSNCSHLTDATLHNLTSKVPLLQHLEIYSVPTLTDAGFTSLLPTTPLLHTLNAEECTELTDTTLFSLAHSPCHLTLTHLQISYCELMTDTGIVDVLRKCPNVSTLEMDNTRMTDVALAEAARIIHSIRPTHANFLRLVVFDCANITWNGIREIMARNAAAEEGALVELKCFHLYQSVVAEHTRLVKRGEREKARETERVWVKEMMQAEEAGLGGGGAAGRLSRNTLRRATALGWGGEGRRRNRGVGCAIM